MSQRIALLDFAKGMGEPGTFTKHSVLPSIGIQHIGAVAQQAGYDVLLMQLGCDDLDSVARHISTFDPQIAGFSAMTWSFPAASYVARRLKGLNPAIRTIFGGDHPSAMPEIVKNNEIDFAVMGEGEKSFQELIEAIETSSGFDKINGIAYKKNGEIIIAPKRDRRLDLDALPLPLRDKETLKWSKIYALMYPPPSQQKAVGVISYSRGCPYHCSFCNVPSTWGTAVRYRTVSRVVDEIEMLQKEYGTNLVFFTDLTFNLINEKVNAICDEILKRDLSINWMAMCRGQRITRSLAVKMKEAGCSKIGIGVESVVEETLETLKSGIKVKEIQEALEILNSVGIITRCYLMIGYPCDEKKTVKLMCDFLKNSKVDELKVSFYTPFPGSESYRWCRDDLITNDFSRFTTDEPVVRVEKMSYADLINARKRLFMEFYGSEEYASRAKEKVRKFPHLSQSYEEFFGFLKERTIL